jgi:hypothetical protein
LFFKQFSGLLKWFEDTGPLPWGIVLQHAFSALSGLHKWIGVNGRWTRAWKVGEPKPQGISDPTGNSSRVETNAWKGILRDLRVTYKL